MDWSWSARRPDTARLSRWPSGSGFLLAHRPQGKHVSHVLGKLGAANRTEAVSRARELSLIP